MPLRPRFGHRVEREFHQIKLQSNIVQHHATMLHEVVPKCCIRLAKALRYTSLFEVKFKHNNSISSGVISEGGAGGFHFECSRAETRIGPFIV